MQGTSEKIQNEVMFWISKLQFSQNVFLYVLKKFRVMTKNVLMCYRERSGGTCLNDCFFLQVKPSEYSQTLLI